MIQQLASETEHIIGPAAAAPAAPTPTALCIHTHAHALTHTHTHTHTLYMHNTDAQVVHKLHAHDHHTNVDPPHWAIHTTFQLHVCSSLQMIAYWLGIIIVARFRFHINFL